MTLITAPISTPILTSISPNAWLSGYVPDIPTPFDETGKLDLKAFEELCDRQARMGAAAIVVCEAAGEASTLSPAEQQTLISVAVETVKGRAKIIAGAGSNSTQQAIELTRHAETAHADAILTVVPYYNKPTQAGIFEHFRAIAGATGLPIILHDAPARTARELANDTLARLATSSQFIGLRDGSGDAARPSLLRLLVPSSFRLLTEDDAAALAYMAAGGDGCFSMVANVAPDLCRIVFSSGKEFRPQTARHLHKALLPIETCYSSYGPSALKYALSLLGLMKPTVRLPLVELDEAAKAEIAEAIARIAADDLICAANAG